ncbi:MAG TPA: NAD(P)-dependent oxidoreductase [Dysgonamonadaceae bacterium]|nr:NAD(P)-dependent oxidoreductase [Dysgonamonadaceae bacterium]MDD4605485.1 NAD(P)-dependent oxidoreductase [Dysgonamonadaceae bacterium]HUI32788.1 NAD(P)-dependent oxidoreductase [Dysgonamonadaceae bacterium]
MKILVATEKPFAKDAIKGMKGIIENNEHEMVLLEKYSNKKELLGAAKSANAIIIRSDIVDKEVLDAAKELKIVVRAGAGYDNVDLDTATAKGVVVMNTPGQNSNAVAELVFGFLLHLTRNGFDGTSGTELKGKKLGLHAFGHIGKIVAHIAQGFGMEVYAYSPSLSRNPERGKEHGVIAVKNPEELYDKSEIVSLHMPAIDATKQSINYELMSRLPENGIVINTARKEVVNEADMVRIMNERPKFKYATDIKPGNHDEMTDKFGKRYFASAKKCGAQTAEANMNAGLAAAQQIIDYFENGNEEFRVNK